MRHWTLEEREALRQGFRELNALSLRWMERGDAAGVESARAVAAAWLEADAPDGRGIVEWGADCAGGVR